MRFLRCLALLCALPALSVFSFAQTDEEIVNEMQRQERALRQKILETEDVTERTKLQRQLVEILDDALTHV